MKVLIIAEIGSVHDGSLGNAMRLVDAATQCGADAVKFQLHIADAETLRGAPAPGYFTAEPRFEYFQRTSFTFDQWQKLKTHCDASKVTFLCSPFSEAAVELLERLGVSSYKIPSGEVTNIPLLDKIARLRKAVFLSSGMSSWAELDSAVAAIRQHTDNVTVLQCTSQYPCEYERVGLNIMQEMRTRYNLPVGLSDHTPTTYASLAAVAFGAVVIEKHFTFSRKMYGSDAANSLEPLEFADLVRGIRAIEMMLSNPVDKDDLAPFRGMKDIFEKSIVAIVDIPSGARLTADMVGLKKPGTGIRADRLSEIIGKRVVKTISAESIVTPSDILWDEPGNA
jgi:N,N'-diacetyllegionaminate synthase